MATDEKIRELIKNRMQDVSSSCRVTSCQVWLRVKDLMNTEVAVIAPDSTMALAATIMADDGFSSLVVVDKNDIMGIITEKDFLEKIAAKGKAAIDIKVRDIMSSPVVSVSPEMTVLEAGKIAGEKHVKRLPVVESGKLVGIVTQTDLIRVLTSYGMWRDVTEIMTPQVATIQRRQSSPRPPPLCPSAASQASSFCRIKKSWAFSPKETSSKESSPRAATPD
jgi:CBS domain-containing protein